MSTFLSRKKMQTESYALKGEFERGNREIGEGRKKALEEDAFITKDEQLGNTGVTEEIGKMREDCRAVFTEKQNLNTSIFRGLSETFPPPI
jgi:phosphate-selective porin